MPTTRQRLLLWGRKAWPFLAGLGSAAVMLLAFLLPSVQDQWDRYRSRNIIQQYVELGDELFDEQRYEMAQGAYEKAFELSEEKRLDIEVKMLRAKVERVNVDPKWGGQAPEELEEVDFQFLLHLLKARDQRGERVDVLNSYGVFLAGAGRPKEARTAFEEAIALDSAYVPVLVNLANLQDQQGKKQEALATYGRSIALDPDNARARYDRALLLLEQGDAAAARADLLITVKNDPDDSDAVQQLRAIDQRNDSSPHVPH